MERNNHQRLLSRFSLVAAWAVLATALLVLLGWAFDIIALKSVVSGFPMMKANVAVGFVMAAAGLILLHNDHVRGSRSLVRLCGIATALLGALSLAQHVSGWDFLFASATDVSGASAGRMSPAAALNFTIFGVTLQLLTAKRLTAAAAADALLMLAMVIGMIALFGYLYTVTALYELKAFSAMAVHTAVLFIVLSAALLAAPPIRGMTAVLAGDDLGAVLARRLLPVAAMAPPLLGYVMLIGQRSEYFGAELRLVFFAMSNVVIFATVIFCAALSLRRADLKRRASEEALHASAERFRLLVDGVCDYAILMLDLKGCITSWNSGAERIYGYQAGEIVGRHILCFYTPEDSAAHNPEMRLKRALEAGAYSEQGWRVRKDGSRFWADVVITALRDAQGRVDGYSKIARDMTERMRAEAAVRDASERMRAEEVERANGQRLRSITDNLNEGLLISTRQGELLHFNKAAYEIFDFSEEEWSPKSPDASRLLEFSTLNGCVLNPDEWPFARIFAGERLHNHELRVRRIDIESTPRILSYSGQVVQDGSGGSVAFLSFSDISERKNAEQQLVKAMKELKRSNSELEQFSYIASHDLQEPLRMVASYTELLSKRYKGRLDADADEFIAYAVDGANRMQQLIRDLLAYSRVSSGGTALHGISSEVALQAAITNLRAAIEESGAIVTHDTLPVVTSDRAQLSQVFQNLVGNAIKYRSAEVPRIHISAATNGDDEWIFSVQDNGMGIAPEHFERVFVLFQRLHGRDEIPGAGIGLAICKKMLEGLGGRIWVESQPGKGSDFRFSLPEGVGAGAANVGQ